MQCKVQLRYRRDGSGFLAFLNVNAVSRKHALAKAGKIAEAEKADEWEATIIATHARTNRELWSEKWNGLLR
jgi:hypothetical protein